MAVNALQTTATVKVLYHTPINRESDVIIQVTLKAYLTGGFVLKAKNIPHIARLKNIRLAGLSQFFGVTLDPIACTFQLWKVDGTAAEAAAGNFSSPLNIFFHARVTT